MSNIGEEVIDHLIDKNAERYAERKQQGEVAKRPASIGMGPRGIQLTTFEEAFRFSKAVIASGLAPKGMDTPEKALIAIQAGAELGFSPMRALAAVTVINGKAGLMGEAALAKIYESGICSSPPIVNVDGEGDSRTGSVVFQRKDMARPVTVTFSVAEAKRAGLWGKAGPWTQYPDPMLGWRAVARMCKLYFGDVLMGLVVTEELQDYTPVESRPIEPPNEPDPLLIEATPPESPVLPDAGGEVPMASLPLDEQLLASLVDKLEGAIVSAESKDQLDAAWKINTQILEQVSDKERARLTKLYKQNRKNFEG